MKNINKNVSKNVIEKENEQSIKKRKKRKKFRHLNQFDRDRIQSMWKAGHKRKEIAEVLGFSKSAISREINKRKTKSGKYIALVAQHKANVKRSNSKNHMPKIEKYPKVRERIIDEMEGPHHRSPDEIAGRMRLENMPNRVSAKSIYNWLHSSWGQRYCKYLCTKRYKTKKQKQKAKREMIPDRISIHDRPQEGIHAQGDLFVSPIKSGTLKSGVVIVIPDTKLALGKFIDNKKPESMRQAVVEKTQEARIDDLTLDNGIENRLHKLFGLPAYFCDSHSPWQKPNVEGFIGLMRRWFIPKGTDLKNVSEYQLQTYFHMLNSKHRKSLGYKSAYEVSLERGIIQSAPNMPLLLMTKTIQTSTPSIVAS
jgi:transposase, IS30 family